MKDIETYNFNGNDIRTLTDEQGEPMFVAKDVADVLGYRDGPNMLRHINRLDTSTQKVSRTPGSGGGNPNVKVLNESGLYTAILHSRRPEAKEFKRWVTSEVLPSIRKHGGYIQGQEEMEPDELMAKAVLYADSKIKELKAQISKDAHKVEYFEAFMDSDVRYSWEKSGRK